MGEGTAPDFDMPRKPAFEAPNRLIFSRAQVWPCNWFQQIENSLDAVHVSFVHQKGRVGTFGQIVTPAIPKLEYVETDAGIRQIATRAKNNVRVSDWTFPNNNHIVVPGRTTDEPWNDVGGWMVPIDDEHTLRFVVNSIPSSGPESDKNIADHFAHYGNYNPADHHNALIHRNEYPEEPLLQLTPAQDYVAQVGQGAIVDRTQERLGASDAGIALLRRIFLRELDAVLMGRSTKLWKRLAEPTEMPLQRTEPADA
jgi:5,5'-dehydrodivanillate O-demethylase